MKLVQSDVRAHFVNTESDFLSEKENNCFLRKLKAEANRSYLHLCTGKTYLRGSQEMALAKFLIEACTYCYHILSVLVLDVSY